MRLTGLARKVPIGATVAAIVAVVLGGVLFAEQTPVHLHLLSQGTRAVFTVDGTTHAFDWHSPPHTLIVVPADPFMREWGIDGSESLTLDTLDPAYLQSICANPYIAVDRWLRGEDGYNVWRALRVRDNGTGRTLPIGTAHARAGGLRLPKAFTFDADIYRLERAVTVELTSPSHVYGLYVDRNARSVSVSDDPAAGTPTMLARWYFPTNPWPYLALNVRTLALGVIWAVLLALLATLLGLLVPLRITARLQPRHDRIYNRAVMPFSALTLGASFIFTLYIALAEYNGMPHTPDAQAYLLQAKVFAHGVLSLPPPPLTYAFPVPYFGVVHGHWLAQYAPGTSLSLAVGIIIGLPWLVQPLLGVGTLALLFALGRRLYGRHVAMLAVVLGALSPLHAFLVGTYLSHTGTAFFGTLAYYLLICSRWGRHLWLTLLAGAALGMTFLCRELSALLIALPLTVYLVLSAWKRGQGRASVCTLLAWGSGVLPFIVTYGLYNWSLSGNPLVSPRHILNPTDRYGFGAGYGWWGQHTLAAGLVNMDQVLTGLMLDLSGWPYYLSLAMPLVPFVLARASRWDVLNAAIAFIIVLATIGYFYHGVMYGPRYVYEAAPTLLLLTARGVQVLGDVSATILAALQRPRTGGHIAAHAILIACIMPNLFFYLPRNLQVYHNFMGVLWIHNLHVADIYEHAPRQAIVVTTDPWIYSRVLAALNTPAALASPTATRDTVWALATSTQFSQLSAAFPHRTLYLLTGDRTNMTFKPWRG
jgi:hypothetical protein